jgi:energy-coupling factor transport system permease protein
MVYRRVASPVHAARASVAAAYFIVLSTLAVVFDHPLLLATLLCSIVVTAQLARVSEVIAAALRFALPLGAAFALLNPLVSQNGLTVLARLGDIGPFGQIDVTAEALAYGGVIALKIVAIVLAARIASACIDPDEMLRSLRRISFHSALTAALATRMVPVLAGDSRRLAEAQRCRPHGSRGGLRGRIAIVRAVVSGALDRSVDVAATLELRGYGSTRRAPRLERPWSRHDMAFALAALILAGLGAAASTRGWAKFEAYPLLSVRLGWRECSLCAALLAIALLPFADRRGIER